MHAAISRSITLTLLVLPPLVLVIGLFIRFPAPTALTIYPSLQSLPPTSRIWSIFPDTYYDGGAYVTFPNGKVRYWLIGPEKGQKVVLINGLSVPSLIWKDIAPVLAKNGFRVLLYDLYGRGYSDAPKTCYDAGLYTTQLALLMQHIKWDKAHIAGLSMGGGIAAAFVSTFPNLSTGRVAFIASTGIMDSSDFSRTSKVMSSPFILQFASSYPVLAYMQYLSSSEPPANPLHEVVQIQSAYLQGFNYALASSLRDGPVRGLEDAFKTLGEAKHEMLFIWGTMDRTVPYKYAARLRKLVPESHFVTVEGGEHDLTISHAGVVSDSLIKFFKKGSVS